MGNPYKQYVCQKMLWVELRVPNTCMLEVSFRWDVKKRKHNTVPGHSQYIEVRWWQWVGEKPKMGEGDRYQTAHVEVEIGDERRARLQEWCSHHTYQPSRFYREYQAKTLSLPLSRWKTAIPTFSLTSNENELNYHRAKESLL